MRPALARLAFHARRVTVPAVLLALLLLAPVARAQSPFAAALYVNDSPITNYEIAQKILFLEFIGAGGENPRERAIERLIEERLQMHEARRMGGRLTPDQIAEGTAEFAARAQLTGEELIARMAEAGIDQQTLDDFIRAGMLWREMVRTLYGQSLNITESQIDQAVSVEGVQPATEVLISEIFLPNDPQYAEALQRIVPQILRITSETEFSNAARQVSAAPTGPAGGRVDRWVDVASIPEPVGPLMATAAVGSVVGPVEMPGALAFFQLRARRESRAVPPDAILIDWRRVALPGGRSEANLAGVAALRTEVDGCADFAGEVLRQFPELAESAIETRSDRLAALSAAERTELERLNALQMSSNMVEGGALVLVMLCSRSVAVEGATPSREDVRMALINRALEGQAELYLQRLRANAEIRQN